MLIMETGFVQLPLVRYDRLILDNMRMMEELDNSVSLDKYNALMEAFDNAITIDSAITIEADYKGDPAVRISVAALADIIIDKFQQSDFADEYQLVDIHKRYPYEIYGLIEKKEDDIDIKAPSDDGDRA